MPNLAPDRFPYSAPINALNRLIELSGGGDADTGTTLGDTEMQAIAHVSHFGALKTSSVKPVLRGNFPPGQSPQLDTDVWSDTLVGSGAISVDSGVARLQAGTGATGSAILESVRQGIFEAGQVTTFQSGVYPGDPVANNIRRWGLMDATHQNGLFFELNGTAFRVVARKSGVDTAVEQSSFNADQTHTPGARNNTYRIFYSAGRAIFCSAANGQINRLHTMTDNDLPLVDDLDLGMYFESTNSAGISVSPLPEMRVRGASVSIFGELPTVRGDETFSDDSVLTPVKSLIAGEGPAGIYRNVFVNDGKALLSQPLELEIARGNIPGWSDVTKFGRNPDIDTGTPEDVWFNGGDYSGFPTGAPEEVEVFSASANDTAAGTGARTVRIQGLLTSDSTEETTEDITLNGTTAVDSVNTWYRVNRVFVLTAGSGGVNAGNITVRHNVTTANVFAVVAAGIGQTAIAAYTVPAGNEFLIESVDIQLVRANGSAGSANVVLFLREFGTGAWRSIRNYEVSTGAPISNQLDVPLVVPPRADLRVRVISVSDSNSVVGAQFGGVLVAA